MLIATVYAGAISGVTRNFQVLNEILGTFKDTGDAAAKPNLPVEPQVKIPLRPTRAQEYIIDL